jgi:hypothetical protein
MWIILKFKKQSLSLLKKDFLKFLGNDVKFYIPKLKLQNYVKNKLKYKESYLLGDYLLCFHRGFDNKNIMSSLKYSRGLKYFLNDLGGCQKDIKEFISKCKLNEDKDGFIKQCFFEFKEDGIFQFLTGPFVNEGFEIISHQNNMIKILIGKFTATVSKESYIFRPV